MKKRESKEDRENQEAEHEEESGISNTFRVKGKDM